MGEEETGNFERVVVGRNKTILYYTNTARLRRWRGRCKTLKTESPSAVSAADRAPRHLWTITAAFFLCQYKHFFLYVHIFSPRLLLRIRSHVYS